MQVIKERSVSPDLAISNHLHFYHHIAQDLIKQLLLVCKKGVDGSFPNICNLSNLIHGSRLIAE
ncbi:hypothetical protein D3C76_913050 [compost metagenome]